MDSPGPGKVALERLVATGIRSTAKYSESISVVRSSSSMGGTLPARVTVRVA